MAQRSNLKITASTVMGAVSSAATSVSSLFETANDGISMLHRSVQTAAEKQRISTDYDLATYEINLHKSVAIEQARANAEIKGFLNENPANEALFKASFDDIGALVAARRQAQAKG